MVKQSAAELLEKGVIELTGSFSDTQYEAFIRYLHELKKWNRAYNLTSIEKDNDIVIKHFLDSLLYLKALKEGEIKVADIGSGAGFPGIPLKIIRPELEMFLVESSGKKAAFLSHIIWQLKLKGIHVIKNRIEKVQIGQEIPCPVDAAVTRALFNVEEFLNKSAHILRKEGVLALSKGPKAEEDAEILKGVKHRILELSLPFTDIKRRLIILYPDNPLFS